MAKFNKNKKDPLKDIMPPFRIVTDNGEYDVTLDDVVDYEYDDYYDDDYYEDSWLEEVDPEEAAKEKALQELEELARKIRATEGE